jgi:hypothetical protein
LGARCNFDTSAELATSESSLCFGTGQGVGEGASTQEVEATNAAGIVRPEQTDVLIPTRKARMLLPWMPISQAIAALSGFQKSNEPNLGHLDLCNRAREVVGRRPAGVDQSNVIFDLPSELEMHLKALESNPKSAKIRAERGEPRLIDLSKICAAQPVIHTEAAVRRVQGVQQDNLLAIAQITMPLPVPQRLPIAYDPSKQAWIISAANPNLRVAGNL